MSKCQCGKDAGWFNEFCSPECEREVKKKETGWEILYPDVSRMKIPGGFLVRYVHKFNRDGGEIQVPTLVFVSDLLA